MSSTSETPGYIPVSEWPNLEALAVGYGEHLMAETNKLCGTCLNLAFSDTTRITHHFVESHVLKWEVVGEDQRGDAECKAFEVRPNIFFIDFYKPDYEEQVSLILNYSTGQAVACISGFHIKNGQKRTWTKFSDASIVGYDSVKPFQPTDDLIGKHVLYRYTPRDAYEHIYLNQGTFTWHCLGGTEKGLADTEPCKMLKLADELYLLFWTEKIMPVESIVVVDLRQMRSTGRFFCWDPKPAKRVQMLFGSYATVLAETNTAAVVASR
ncbi:molybdenum cofactor biosynthesis protein F [Aspergillus ambiguus]|uniref:molybdenum cofactor biosynthesis F family protein n=1 Tax=Aspergillus ambiguus TaxID=176160 RepID=UPI003CCCBC81